MRLLIFAATLCLRACATGPDMPQNLVTIFVPPNEWRDGTCRSAPIIPDAKSAIKWANTRLGEQTFSRAALSHGIWAVVTDGGFGLFVAECDGAELEQVVVTSR